MNRARGAALAILATLVAVPFVMNAGFGTPAASGSAAPLASASSAAPAASTVPAASTEPVRSALPSSVGDVPIDLASIHWIYTPPATVLGGPEGRYLLQAGTLSEDEPIVDLEVPWRAEIGGAMARGPAIGAFQGGSVVYVADDGSASQIHRVEVVTDGSDEILATLDEVIWDIAVAPDGSAAYAAVVGRADQTRDLGVVRILLDGSGSVEPIMPPAVLASIDVRRVAELAFQIDLRISTDGRYLIRRTCDVGGCVVHIADVATGRVIDLGNREVYGVVAGAIVSRQCGAAACRLEVTDIATGTSRSADVDVFGPLAEIDGVPVVVPTLDDGTGVITVQAIDPASGQSRVLYRPPAGTELITADFFDLHMHVPDGFFHLIEIAPVEIDGVVVRRDERHLLIPLTEGEVIEVPRPAYRQPAGFGTQG